MFYDLPLKTFLWHLVILNTEHVLTGKNYLNIIYGMIKY